MLITTNILLASPHPDQDGLTNWLNTQLGQYPITMKRVGESSYDLEADHHYVGNDGQTIFDLHAAAILWLILQELAPRGIDMRWSNSYVDQGQFQQNTVSLEFLASSYRAQMWIASVVRPNLQARFTGRVF